MRIDATSVPQSMIDSAKALDKKELTDTESRKDNLEESQPFIPSPFGSSRTYSLSSLRGAVEYHAKFLTVADNNLAAVNHPPLIPKGILDKLNAVK